MKLKKTSFIVGILIGFLFLLINISQIRAQTGSDYRRTILTDNFESGLTGWTVEQGNDCQIGTTSAVPTGSPGGSAVKITRRSHNTSRCRLTRVFPEGIRDGKMTIWFYDNADNRSAQNNVIVAAKDNAEHIVWLGVKTRTNSDHYDYRLSSSTGYTDIVSKSRRTTGWHKFEFYIYNHKSYGAIDGVIIQNLGQTTALSSINQVVIAADLQNAQIGEAFIDGLSVESITNGDRPNILMLLTDDQTVDSMKVMQKVNNLLASRGVSFKNSFVTYSFCCPSRATFLSGQYPHNNKVTGSWPGFGGYMTFNHDNALPIWLTNAGYQTAHFGKYLNGYGRGGGVVNGKLDPFPQDLTPYDNLAAGWEIPPGWAYWQGTLQDGYGGVVRDIPYDYFDFVVNNNWNVERHRKESGENDETAYITDVMTNKAVDYLRNHAESSSMPFFMYFNYYGPHVSGQCEGNSGIHCALPANRHKDTLNSMSIPVSAWPNFNEADISDKPAFLQQKHPNPLSSTIISGLNETYRSDLEAMLSIDESVEEIVGVLDDIGKLDNTVIIFTSDNGNLMGQHRTWGKVQSYEESIRTPLVIYYPGVTTTRTVREDLVVNVDIAPTIVDLARTNAGLVMDGKSLVPLLRGQNPPWRQYFLLESHTNEYSGGSYKDYTGIRTKDYKYVEYYPSVFTQITTPPYFNFINKYAPGSRTQPTLDHEFYNLKNDPFELNNIYNSLSSSSPAMSAFVDDKMHRLQTCSGIGCFPTDVPPVLISCESYTNMWINGCTPLNSWVNNSTACNTSSRSVTLRNNVTGATQVRYADTPRDTYCNTIPANDPSWRAWENVTTSKNWTLPESSGEKKVCAEFKNNYNSIKCGGTIRYVSTNAVVATFYPTDDTMVNGGSARTNYGQQTDLKVDASPKKITYIKFNIGSIPSGRTIQSASLRVKVRDASTKSQNVYFTQTTNWAERTVTYNNRPGLGSLIRSYTNFFQTPNRIYEIDLTNAVSSRMSADKILSIAIDTTESNPLWFYSKESASANRPQLIVTYR